MQCVASRTVAGDSAGVWGAVSEISVDKQKNQQTDKIFKYYCFWFYYFVKCPQ